MVLPTHNISSSCRLQLLDDCTDNSIFVMNENLTTLKCCIFGRRIRTSRVFSCRQTDRQTDRLFTFRRWTN